MGVSYILQYERSQTIHGSHIMKSKKLLLKGSYRRNMLFWKSRLFSNTKQKLQDKNSRDQNRGTDRHTHIPPQQGEKRTAASFLFVGEAAPPEDI